MADDDPLLAALARLDPTIGDAPPGEGSDRHRQILETAMTRTPTPGADPDFEELALERIDTSSSERSRRGRRRRRLVLAGAGIAACVIAVAAVAITGGSGARPEPVAALTEAAAATGDVSSLRIHGRYVGEDGTRTIDVDVDGRDYHLRSQREGEPDGSGEWTIGIGDQQWSDEDPEPLTMPDEQRNEPFPEASRAVVDAALKGAKVEDLGDEQVGDTEAVHYRIDLGEPGVAALSALAPNQVAMFELEYPQGVTSLDVWVADGLIRRLEIQFADGQAQRSVTLDYVDLGADITITPPS